MKKILTCNIGVTIRGCLVDWQLRMLLGCLRTTNIGVCHSFHFVGFLSPLVWDPPWGPNPLGASGNKKVKKEEIELMIFQDFLNEFMFCHKTRIQALMYHQYG